MLVLTRIASLRGTKQSRTIVVWIASQRSQYDAKRQLNIINPCTKNLASYAHQSRAFLDGNRIVIRHAHRDFLELGLASEIVFLQCVENLLQVLEFLADFVFVVGEGSHAHHTADTDVLHLLE